MHRYTVEGNNRVKVIGLITAASIVTSLILHIGLSPRIDTLPLPDYILPFVYTVLSIGVIFALFYETYKEYGWRMAPQFVSPIPNLSGEWEGCVSEDGEPLDFDAYLSGEECCQCGDDMVPANLTVSQNFEKIEFDYTPEKNGHNSKSQVAMIRGTYSNRPVVYYLFKNEGDSETGEYYGGARLDLGDDVLRGQYFTGPVGPEDGQAVFERS
ncbi:hypothetical protein EGH22_17550 [Halomicroarcula sp. F28]|uniref:hypothetical protein n=1 Tax=Haloarcula salinisoli TaxID=2487746 RepID=UPI001C72FC50|nr:hypothetical protein [Halomicroarcula salinisoli]MBX0288139.1 hypothetical protein [Halomicroarcula salinisoli]